MCRCCSGVSRTCGCAFDCNGTGQAIWSHQFRWCAQSDIGVTGKSNVWEKVSASPQVRAESSIRMVFGRCSVRTFLPEAIRLLKANLDLFETFVEEIVSVEKAPEYYERFERNEIGKVAFRMTEER